MIILIIMAVIKKTRNHIKEKKNCLFNTTRKLSSLFLIGRAQWLKELIVLVSLLILTFPAGFHNERVRLFKKYL